MPSVSRVAAWYLYAGAHDRSVALMKFLGKLARRLGVSEHVYVVGGAVRDFFLDRPIKDIDVVIDSVALGGRKDSEWFAKQVVRAIPALTSMTTNQYGVAIVTVNGPWVLDGEDMNGEVIEIANARRESYSDSSGKPSEVSPTSIREDLLRRELTYNTLLWRLHDVASGPDKKDILDLLGCGLDDLAAGFMQCPSDPVKTFRDDPTRMLRVIKFAVRYGHRLSKDAKAAIRANAHLLRRHPQNAVFTILRDDILTESGYKKALTWMADLGLLEPIAEMIREIKDFRTSMLNLVRLRSVQFMFDLMKVGLPVDAQVQFLSPGQRKRFQEVTLSMDPEKSRDYLERLRQPGKAWADKRFAPALAQEKGLSGKAIGPFMGRVTELARSLMLENPELAWASGRLRAQLRRALE